ncbi:MAG: hypothetical protein H7338_14965 [Candidatus Sericytochromatia bacterium]|nr:hypothetical protein [Candidatus Sericytochromatia bacterium]
MPFITIRRPLLSSGILVSLGIAAWCAACTAPSPTAGDAASRFATRTTAVPSNYPMALPTNWESYAAPSGGMTPTNSPSAMPSGWPPSNLGTLLPQGYGTGGTAGVTPGQIGPSAWTGNNTSNLPSNVTSTLPRGLNPNGAGTEVVGGSGMGMIGGLFGPASGSTGPRSSDLVQPDSGLGFNSNTGTPSIGGTGYQNAGGLNTTTGW